MADKITSTETLVQTGGGDVAVPEAEGQLQIAGTINDELSLEERVARLEAAISLPTPKEKVKKGPPPRKWDTKEYRGSREYF